MSILKNIIYLSIATVIAIGMSTSFSGVTEENNFSVKPITAVTVIESAEGGTEEDLNQDVLVNIENIMKDKILANTKIQYMERGYDPQTINLKFVTESHYIYIQGKKLAVVNIVLDSIIQSVYILGITGNEMIRVSCMRTSNHKIPLASGVCAEEIYSAFGVRVFNK